MNEPKSIKIKDPSDAQQMQRLNLLRNELHLHKERAILALLEHSTREKAAEAIGVHATTLWRWEQDPQFSLALREARREVFLQSTGRLQAASSEAAETLITIMTDPKAPPGSRIRAAEAVLEQSYKSFETQDLNIRLTELEELNRRAQFKASQEA